MPSRVTQIFCLTWGPAVCDTPTTRGVADYRAITRRRPESEQMRIEVVGELANPMKAHNGYQTDERVIGLITKGLGQGEADPVQRKQCTWLEMVDE